MSTNKFSNFPRYRSLNWEQWWDTAVALPSWLTATIPANVVHSAVGVQAGGGYHQVLVQAAAVNGTVAKIETASMSLSALRMYFEVGGWRFIDNTANEMQWEIYIAGATRGFRFYQDTTQGKAYVQFIGETEQECKLVELASNGVGNMCKRIGIELLPNERRANIWVEGGLFASFDSGVTSWGSATDIKAGIKVTKNAGTTDRWLRYEGFRMGLAL